MATTAALFSGQGAQYPGMGQDLCQNYKAAREIYECAGDIIGFDVLKTSVSASEEQLAQTAVAQPCIYTLSIAAFTVAKQELPALDIRAVAGHSLGEYAALYCAGAFSLSDGFRIIKARAEAMQQAAKTCKGAMYAILSSDEESVAAACEQAAGFVQPANFNLPAQTVISGEEAAAAQAAEILTRQGAKAVRLSVGSAFHTKIMQPAAQCLQQALAGIAFTKPQLDFYSNLTGGLHSIEDFPAYFARHMVSPVRFVQQIAAMTGAGVDLCVEFGPKKTAATLAKKNCKALTVMGVEDQDSLQKLSGGLL